MIKKLKKYWEILIILVLGLTPLLWYKTSNSLALGHDMGFPIDPIMFFRDRLFLWTDRVGLGWDQTLGSAAVLLHGLEALVASFNLGIFVTQKIVFIFWFVLPGLAMYYFVSTIHKERNQWFIRLSASLFYMFNHFLLQGWFIAERTKISLVIALPLLLAFAILTLEHKTSVKKGLALISLTLFLFNGGGGIPLYGGILLSFFLALIFFGLIQIKINGKKELKRIVLFCLGLLSSFILVNAYWVLPLLSSLFTSYRQNVSTIGGISGIISWSAEISKFASYLNLFRLQGIPDWYDNPLHPYSNIFFTNPVFILISFLIPVIVFSSLFIVRKYFQHLKIVLFFNLLALVAIIFTAGSHLPFGFVYNFFLGFVPGFAIFRSPFYKFAPALWFSYSYLFSFSMYFLIKELKKPKFIVSKYVENIGFVLILFLILCYSFPFFAASFFKWQNPFSTMVRLPSYVLDFDKWVNINISDNDRILTLPDLNQEWNAAVYNWSYWSTAPLASLLTNKSIVTNDKVLSANAALFTNKLYDSILNDTLVWKKISQLMGINYFLLQNDFAFGSSKFGTDNPDLYREKISGFGNVTKNRSFGAWDLYKITDNDPKKIFLSSDTALLLTKNGLNNQLFDVDSIFNLPNSDNENYYFTNNFEKKNIPTNNFTRTILIENCLYCDQKVKEINLDIPVPKILPGSIFYRFVKNKEYKEEREVKNDISKQIDFYLGMSLKRIGEAKQMILLKEKNENIILVFEEIKKNLKKINNLLDSINKHDPEIALQVLRTDNFLRAENRSLNDIAQKSNNTIQDQADLLRDYIARIYKKNNPFEFIYPPDNEKHYNFSIELPGSYEILLKKQDLGKDLSFKKIILDGQNVATIFPRNSYYLTLGKIFLTKGSHNLQFETDNTENLLKQTSDFSITPGNQDCKAITVDKMYPNHRYVLSFNYVTEGDGYAGPELSVSQFIDDKEILFSKSQLGANTIPQTFNTDILPLDKVNKLSISVCHAPGYESNALIKISNLKLETVIMPIATLILDKTQTKKLSDYSIDKVNQTKYKVTVRGANSPYLLIFNDTFNSDWKVYYGDTTRGFFGSFFKKPISENNHLMINGFSNGWVIDRKGEYSLTIEYSPQKYFYLGWIITFAYVISIIAYLIFSKYYGQKN